MQLAGRTQEAIPQYEAALRLNPELAQAHYNLGFALEGVSRMQEAIPQYEEAVRLKPDYADAHNNLAGILRAQGKLQEAIDHYEQAIREKPVSASYKVERVAVQHCDTQCVFDTAII